MDLAFWKRKTHPIYFHNTLTGRKDELRPVSRKAVTMYNCGPTVYQAVHIGNLRPYIFADTIKRALIYNGYAVKQVINITDVGHLVGDGDEGEDKMNLSAQKEHKSAEEIAHFYIEAFLEDIKKLNVIIDGVQFPRATEFITEQIQVIKQIEKKGAAYITSDGVYFDTATFPDYGKLGNIDLEGLEEGKRIGINREKRNPTDFALWKFSAEGIARQQEWESPWGKGFPGWSIECSAMALSLLGETIDIHTGGIDHIPVHHNNEIAQSEMATSKPFAHIWMHNAFITIDTQKIAKSIGNTIYLQELEDRHVHPLAYRLWILSATYRTPMNFTWDAVGATATSYKRLLEAVTDLGSVSGAVSQNYNDRFRSFISDDLNTPKAIALMWDLLRDTAVTAADKRATLLLWDTVLGLNLEAGALEIVQARVDLPEEIQKIVSARADARAKRDWSAADQLREEAVKLGYKIEDKNEEQKVTKL